MHVGKCGSICYLDSITHGLVKGRAVAVTGETVTVRFDTSPETDSWHGRGGNPWSGRTETYPHSQIVPAGAIVKPSRGRFYPRIASYSWVPDNT